MLDCFALNQLMVRDFGRDCDYHAIWQRAVKFSKERDITTPDEIWLFACSQVITVGTANDRENILDAGNIPIVKMDRTGGATYHGPGQLMFGTILDLERLKMQPSKIAYVLSGVVTSLLKDYNLGDKMRDERNRIRPFIDGANLSFIDLGVLNGRCYHGLSLNVDLDLLSFSRINPCGHKDMRVTRLKDHIPKIDWQEIKNKLCNYFAKYMGYSMLLWEKDSKV